MFSYIIKAAICGEQVEDDDPVVGPGDTAGEERPGPGPLHHQPAGPVHHLEPELVSSSHLSQRSKTSFFIYFLKI